MRTPCRNCGQRPGIRGKRLLCWRCSRDPAVRERHATDPRFRRGVLDYNGTPQPCTPTDALPGSVEKFTILCARALAGIELHSPGDAGIGRPAVLASGRRRCGEPRHSPGDG